MKQKFRWEQLWKSLYRYFLFFLIVAFSITCCMMLFLNVLSHTLAIEFTEEHVNTAAKLTFANVIFLTLIFTVMDRIRRKITVQRPIQKITDAANRMMQGDFSVRIEPERGIFEATKFNPVIDCFNNMAKELSGIETLRTDFIANVSHELKTPLAVIQNYGRMLQQPNLSDEQRMEYAQAIIESSRRLAELISNILKLNKLENQQIFPATTEYDLGEQLCENLLQFESVWEKKEIQVETDLAENVTVTTDKELLSLVWNNLFSNAFKFTQPGGQVYLTLRVEKTQAIVEISDTGCGISPDVGAHIFEKFYQGDPSHATQGNGLGLALVKRVIDILQGQIHVKSTVGKGTTFTVILRRNAV